MRRYLISGSQDQRSLRSSLFRFLLAGESESQGKVARTHGVRAKRGMGGKGWGGKAVDEREAIRHNDWSIARQSKRSMSTACQ